MSAKRRCGLALCILLALCPPLFSQALNPRLAPLEPLLDREWKGMLPSPDGSEAWEQTCRFESIWDGKVIRYLRSTPAINSYEEGFLYWDDIARKIAFFSIHSSAVYCRAFLSVEKNVITFEGKMSWPAPPANPGVKQSYDFRNTLELVSDSAMIDRWFQNAFGPWRPGHVISFRSEGKNSGVAPPMDQ